MKTVKEIEDLVLRLKKYRDNIYNISPQDLSKFIKLKSNLIRRGIYITDEMLDLPTEQVVALLKKQIEQLGEYSFTEEKEYQILDAITDLEKLDLDLLDQERARLRKAVLAQETVVKITKSGKSFSINTSSSVKSIRINIPSVWNIEMPQSLLLELYDKAFGIKPTTNFDSAVDLVLFLFQRYRDYSAVKQVLEIEIVYNSKLSVAEVRDELLHQALSKGLDDIGSLILAILVDLVVAGRVKDEQAKSWLGVNMRTRKRLLQLFNELLEGAKCASQ